METNSLPEALQETKEEQTEAPKMRFNEAVHVQDEHGDPARKENGEIKLKTNWKDKALDRQGRTYNPKVHGKERELDNMGFLKVRRRDEKISQGNTSRTEALVAKYYEKGYAYYVANDEGGRLEQMVAKDWEPDQGEDGPAEINV